ncbi:Beta-lactamase [Dickeya dianthicola]|uniref:Class A beta-lactamase-related serine hydrolase n=1 Tax=Dickeya dianthicola TaxID=204039 RepID=A0ABX9NV19_9GAMM|nr:serine hydrolase domain-containing protein [Dickeya dianthicola]AYC21047.1 Beta-lactamase [Dickeya dianthicola]MBI0436994.1 beta-lactamase family protein [Dickeya dianthicola]MBI0448837.1 beta-lactamase family protein [Dickeya dianthicola]MBI0452718.1 beta-lactamase family protein [Dickeya dianthicola]MBI0457208.1 beta-lactamase family protein [Dickeya dianthicola]
MSYLRAFSLNLLLILSCFMLCACGTLSQVTMPARYDAYLTHSSFPANVDDMVHHYMKDKSVSGISIAVIHNQGPAQFYCYGVTDEQSRYAITPDTLFALGSISKGITADVVSQLVLQKKLRWEDTLATLLPKNTPLSEDAKRITLLQLVTHTSGLPRQDIDFPILAKFVRYLGSGENFYGELDSDEVLHYLADFSVPSHPATQYSNLGYAILGYILKDKFHQNIEEMAKAGLFTPLAMQQTSFRPETLARFAFRALGHAGDQPKFIARGALTPDWHFSNNMLSAAGLYSNAHDLIIYLRAHLDDSPSPLINQTFAQINQGYARHGNQVQNIAWVTDADGKNSITYQVGYIGGYSSFIGFDKQHGNAIVVLQNAFNWSNYLGIALLTDLAERR